MAMTVILRIGDTSASDISLTSSGVAILDTPWLNTPDVNQQVLQNLEDGNSLGVPEWSNVTESIDLHISDSSAALVAAKVQSIERLLDLARQGTLGYLDDKLYLRVQFDHDSLVWRSQILAAKLEMEEGANQIWKKYVRGTLIITLRYYFETESMQDVAVSSGPTSSATTSYATIHNNDDALSAETNWVQIAAAQVTGSIPAPAKIYVKNISGATRNAYNVFMGNYVFNDPANVDPIFRGSQADGGDTTPGTTETEVAYWHLGTGNLVESFRGQFGRYVVVYGDRPATDTLVRAAFQYRGPVPDADMAVGEQFLNTNSHYVMDLGALPIPPTRYATGMAENLYLAIKGKTASGTETVTIDWLQIFPTGKGRYRVLESIFGSMTLSNNNEIVDDGPNESAYLLTSGGDALPLYKPLYTPLYLWPNRLQRIRVLVGSGALSFEAGEQFGIKIAYRPRRLSF
jgi:hypothetical protein